MTYDQLPADIQDFFKWSWVQCPSYQRWQKTLEGTHTFGHWINDSFYWEECIDKHDVWEEIDDMSAIDPFGAIKKIRETKFYAQYRVSHEPPPPFNPQAIQDMRHAIEELPV